MPVIRQSLNGPGAALAPKCAAALSAWEDLEDPCDIEQAVVDFIPKDEPFRSEAIETLAKVRARRCLGCQPSAARVRQPYHAWLSRSSRPDPNPLSRSQMMHVDLKSLHEEDEMINAIVSAATLRVVQKDVEARGSRASMSGANNRRMSADDSLDIVKLVIVGDSGTGKTCLMLRFTKEQLVLYLSGQLRCGNRM